MRSPVAVQSAFFALALSVLPTVAHAGVFVSVAIAPPVLPVYVQPPLPAPGYIWAPGYWAYGPDGYFWVPGTWILPPQPGLLWTPGYWGWRGGFYVWNAGFWGPHVGFYGGVNYGFGYTGVGYYGGRWMGGVFSYNAAVMNVGGGVVVNSYRENVVVNNIHTSYNGGEGGLRAQPSAFERSAMAEHHFEPTREQNLHHEIASRDRGQLASVNHGRPASMAMARPAGAGSPVGGTRSAGAMNHPSAASNRVSSGAPGRPGGSPSQNSPAASRPVGSVNHASPSVSNSPAGSGQPHPTAGGQAHPSGGSNGGSKGAGKPSGHPAK
ncbi:MAG TPA: hypothetical protein VMT15_01705 [Bryobacteraceae bacterium]|nr:hypothetical protein [Bryobacteraceae bacterium]